jgi:membrane-associated phospholipid phosphatase
MAVDYGKIGVDLKLAERLKCEFNLMRLSSRLALLALPLLLQLIYFPTNRMLSGGWKPVSMLDSFIPLWPIFALPYLATIGYWCIFHLWAAIKMDDELFLPFITASITTIAIGMACFILFPTYVDRPQVTEAGFAWDMLRLVYRNDGLYNALPSGHAYITSVVTYFFMKWKPRLNPVWIVWWMIVLLSAVVTKQHYILDLVAGVVVAALAVAFSQWSTAHLMRRLTKQRKLLEIE